MRKSTFPGRYESLIRISRFVKKAAEDAHLDDPAIYAVDLAVNEACANIIEHAYGGEEIGVIHCSCHITEEGLTVTLTDYGQPFDPSNVPEPDPSLDLEQVKPRGAGLFLMRKMMDEVRFKFIPGKGNVLTMVKKRE